jgi:hypothetical protein
MTSAHFSKKLQKKKIIIETAESSSIILISPHCFTLLFFWGAFGSFHLILFSNILFEKKKSPALFICIYIYVERK